MKRRIFDNYPPEIEAVKAAGFAVFEDGDFDLNIIGFRNINDELGYNQFNDRIVIAYKYHGKWITEEGAATTDAGRYWLTKPDYKACAIMCHNRQYRGAYKLGLHKGRLSLIQIKPVEFWRDGNKDNHLDYVGKIYKDVIGLNIHASSQTKNLLYVDKWSAGCQVWQSHEDHEKMIYLCNKQVSNLGYHTFSYTLLTE